MFMSAKGRRGRRRDGVRVNEQHGLNALFPYLMKRRCDSLIFFTVQLEMEPLQAYMSREKEAGREIRFFEFFCAALVKLLREREHINRFIKGRRLYQRESVVISTVAKREMSDQGAETNLILHFSKEATFDDILAKLRNEIKTAKTGAPPKDDKIFEVFLKLPRSLLMATVRIFELMDWNRGPPRLIEEIDPMRASAFVANLGSVGVDAPYHHLYEWGTCSLFMTIGCIKKTPVVLEDETLGVRTMVECKIVMDERVADGYYYARSLDMFKSYFAEPEKLVESMHAN